MTYSVYLCQLLIFSTPVHDHFLITNKNLLGQNQKLIYSFPQETMAIHFIGKCHTSNSTFEFKSRGEDVFADYYQGPQLQGTYSLNTRSLEVVSSIDMPLHRIVTELLTENYVPYIREGLIEWDFPVRSRETVVEVEQHFFRARKCMGEANYPEVIDALLTAQDKAARVLDPFGEANFLEKLDRRMLQELVDRTKDSRIEFLLLQKDAVRRAFELSLQHLSTQSSQVKKPNCFICFSIEDDVGYWLEHTFVPDLDRMGIEPLFCFRQLGPGKELNRFQKLISTTDLVVLICTPDLQKKCIDRASNPTGVAEEVVFARDRHNNDPGRRDTIFPIYLKGSRELICPYDDFKSILGPELTLFGNNTPVQLYSYYASVFEVFGNMRNIPRARSREVKQTFLVEIRKTLRDKIIDRDAVGEWLVERAQHQKEVEAAAGRTVEAAMGIPLIKLDRIRLNDPHPNFVGREDQLDEIKEAFQLREWIPTNPTIIKILCGPGGIGKTEIAFTFGNNFLTCFSLIWVIRAGSQNLFEADYRSLAKALSLHIENDNLQAVQRKVHRALERGIDDSSQPWLLIFDNATERIKIPRRGGYVLGTSQHQEVWEDPNAFIPVPPFSPDEISSLFRKINCYIMPDDIQSLAVELEGFPVLLEQVGHFLRRTDCTVSEYLKEIFSLDDILWADGGQRYPKALGRVYQKALEVLERKHKLAHLFIQFCAYLNPDRISSQLLDFWVQTKNFSITDKRTLIGALNDCFLMRYQASTQSYSLHRLVQVVLQRLDEKHRGEQYHLAGRLLGLWAKQFDWNKMETWQIGEETVRHLVHVKNCRVWETLDRESKSNFLFACGLWFSRVNENPKEGLELIREGYNCAGKHYPKESKEMAHYLSEIGVCYWKMKENEPANDYFLRSLEMRKTVLGMSHSETAASYNNLFLTTQEGPLKKLEYIKKALEIWEKVHQGKAHSDIALGYHNMGYLQYQMGNIDEALAMINKAIQINQNYFKKSHPATAQTHVLLGQIQQKISPALALSSFHEAARIYESVHGRADARVAGVLVRIGKYFKDLGQFDPALQNYEEGLKIYRQLYGENHSKTAEICMYEGDVLQEVGDIDKSLTVRERGLKIWETIHVEDHYDLSWGHFDVARSLSKLCRFEEALIHFQEALRILILCKGPDSDLTLGAYNNVGATLESLNNHLEALSNYTTAFKGAVHKKDSKSSTYFKHVLESLQKQTDAKLVLSTITDLLAFCLLELGENNEYKAQLEAIASAKKEGCQIQ